jgi:uncharacterized protein
LAVLIDTSAIYGILDRTDPHHGSARASIEHLRSTGTGLVTHSYVLAETCALVQRRLGVEPVIRLHQTLIPMFDITWVDRDLHDRALAAVRSIGRKAVSLVDCTSFVLMRDLGIGTALAFDGDFVTQGFDLATA